MIEINPTSGKRKRNSLRAEIANMLCNGDQNCKVAVAEGGLQVRDFKQSLSRFRLALALIVSVGCMAPANAAKDVYTYDISPDGPVHVTVRWTGNHPTLSIPATAENVRASDLEYTLTKNWGIYSCRLDVKTTGPNPEISYDWADGALPWPTKVTDSVMSMTEKRWFVDNFGTEGPADVVFILPKGAEVLDYRERDCPMHTDTVDGRVRVTYEVASGRFIPDQKRFPTRDWLGLCYSHPWENKYAVYAPKSSTPFYYPASLSKYPEYMAKVKEFHNSCQDFAQTYTKRLNYTPPRTIMYAVGWVLGYGGAYCSGTGIYFNYRGIASYEWPPVTDGGKLMGAYHETAHLYQPPHTPDYLGGHTWTAYFTMDYDYYKFPTPDEVAKRIKEGVPPDQHMADSYKTYRQLKEKNLVPALWYQWPETPELLKYMEDTKCPDKVGTLRELACAYVMLKMERDFGSDYWGKVCKLLMNAGIEYDRGTVGDPINQKIFATLLGEAAGRDLTSYLTKLTDCDLKIELKGTGSDPVSNGGMESNQGWALTAWQPSAKMEYDNSVTRSGKKSIKLTCPEPNDAKVIQIIKVEPKTYYIISGWIKVQDVDFGQAGATICAPVDNGSFSIKGMGTNDWKQVAVVLYSGDKSEMDIALRLGWSGNPVPGTAWFDDVKMYPLFSEKGWQCLRSLGK